MGKKGLRDGCISSVIQNMKEPKFFPKKKEGKKEEAHVLYISSKAAGRNSSIIDIIDDVLSIYWNQEIW